MKLEELIAPGLRYHYPTLTIARLKISQQKQTNRISKAPIPADATDIDEQLAKLSVPNVVSNLPEVEYIVEDSDSDVAQVAPTTDSSDGVEEIDGRRRALRSTEDGVNVFHKYRGPSMSREYYVREHADIVHADGSSILRSSSRNLLATSRSSNIDIEVRAQLLVVYSQFFMKKNPKSEPEGLKAALVEVVMRV